MTATVSVGGSVALVATAFDLASQPINGVPFTWTSTDPQVATVSATGVVTGVSPGDVVILASAANGVAGSAEVHVDDGAPPVLDVRINEIHYDNFGTDAGEAIEIEGPAGANLDGFAVVLYNGNGGAAYSTRRRCRGVLPASCGTRGVLVVDLSDRWHPERSAGRHRAGQRHGPGARVPLL